MYPNWNQAEYEARTRIAELSGLMKQCLKVYRMCLELSQDEDYSEEERLTYLKEAESYRKQAEDIKIKLESEANHG